MFLILKGMLEKLIKDIRRERIDGKLGQLKWRSGMS